MPNQSKHASINIGLIQAREALMTQFRPILNQANITDQQWRIIRLLAEKRHIRLPRSRQPSLHLTSQPDRHPDPTGKSRLGGTPETL